MSSEARIQVRVSGMILQNMTVRVPSVEGETVGAFLIRARAKLIEKVGNIKRIIDENIKYDESVGVINCGQYLIETFPHMFEDMCTLIKQTHIHGDTSSPLAEDAVLPYKGGDVVYVCAHD